MSKSQISLRVDDEFLTIIERHRRPDETTVACIRRLVKTADDCLSEVRSIRRDQRDGHERMFQMLDSFLQEMRRSEARDGHANQDDLYANVKSLMEAFFEDVKEPFTQINEHLAAINARLGEKR